MANFFKDYHKERIAREEAEQMEKLRREQEEREQEQKSRVKWLKQAIKNWSAELDNDSEEWAQEYARNNIPLWRAELKEILAEM